PARDGGISGTREPGAGYPDRRAGTRYRPVVPRSRYSIHHPGPAIHRPRHPSRARSRPQPGHNHRAGHHNPWPLSNLLDHRVGMSRTTSRAGVVSCDFVSIQSDPEVVITIIDLDVPVIGYPGMGPILDPDPVLVIDIAPLARLRPLQHGPLGDDRFALRV